MFEFIVLKNGKLNNSFYMHILNLLIPKFIVIVVTFSDLHLFNKGLRYLILIILSLYEE